MSVTLVTRPVPTVENLAGRARTFKVHHSGCLPGQCYSATKAFELPRSIMPRGLAQDKSSSKQVCVGRATRAFVDEHA
jgi:hypothetical protein